MGQFNYTIPNTTMQIQDWSHPINQQSLTKSCTGKEDCTSVVPFYSSPPPICTSNILSSKKKQTAWAHSEDEG